MKDVGEIFIDPAQPPAQNATNLATLRELRARFYRLARNEPDMMRSVALFERAWMLDDIIRMGEEMEATMEEQERQAGHYVELFSGRFYEVRADGWGPNPLRVYDLRRRSIAKSFSTPESANGYAREQEEQATPSARWLKRWFGRFFS